MKKEGKGIFEAQITRLSYLPSEKDASSRELCEGGGRQKHGKGMVRSHRR